MKCFLLCKTGTVRQSLRRFCSDETKKCSGKYGYHNASVAFGVAPEDAETPTPPHDHPEWPKKCECCDYDFTPEDTWQLFKENLFVRQDTGEQTTLRDAPAGAMWLATWMPPAFGSIHFKALPTDVQAKGHLIVKLPGGHDWDIDTGAKNGTGWTRQGEPPMVTARPSILVPGYHGFLTNGELEAC